MEKPDLTPQGTEQVEKPTENEAPAQIIETTPPNPVQPKPEETAEFWKEKATNQAKENIVLNDKLKQYESRRELKNEPTDSDLRQAFPSWDYMDDVQKEIARRTFRAERLSEQHEREKREVELERQWNTELDMAIEANPKLEGKEREFKAYASKPTHKGAPIETLVKAFLFETSSDIPPTKPTQQGLEPGSGGPRESDAPAGLSNEEIEVIRTTDPKRYRELIRQGKI